VKELKIKTFLRINFGLFFLCMSVVNYIQSSGITSVSSLLGTFVFIGMEIVLLAGSLIGYKIVTKNVNKEEEL